MTYCLGIKTNDGIVMVSDSRTTASIDNVNTYSKMWRYDIPGNRQLTICSAGNLATTQAVISQIERDIANANPVNLMTVNSLFEAANYIGRLSLEAQKLNTGGGAIFESSFLLGGSINGGPCDLFMIYPEGNCIASSTQKPFLQIGEIKYGKPILDRVITATTPLDRAVLCALISMDATMRSNLSVGPPIEIAILEQNGFNNIRYHIFEEDNDYLHQLRNTWNQLMVEAFDRVIPFNWRV